MRLAGMPKRHVWPSSGERCQDPQCCAKEGRQPLALIGKLSGNILAPVQGEFVLRRLGLTVDDDDTLPDSGRALRMGTIADKYIPEIAQRWHLRLGHPGITKLKDALKEQP